MRSLCSLVLPLVVTFPACKENQKPNNQTTHPRIVSLVLINPETDRPIDEFNPLTNGAKLDLTKLETKTLNILANTSPATIDSVTFTLVENNTTVRDSNPPYCLPGDTSYFGFGRNYAGMEFSLGKHTLVVTPYKGGSAGPSLRVTFEVVK